MVMICSFSVAVTARSKGTFCTELPKTQNPKPKTQNPTLTEIKMYGTGTLMRVGFSYKVPCFVFTRIIDRTSVFSSSQRAMVGGRTFSMPMTAFAASTMWSKVTTLAKMCAGFCTSFSVTWMDGEHKRFVKN
jgi:hypothetical protein